MPVAEIEFDQQMQLLDLQREDELNLGAEPSDEDSANAPNNNVIPSTKPAKPIVGIIFPPPEVRNIVDKTAAFVARNGPEFESRIRHNEQNNPKFNFLSKDDPYHAYYKHKVKEIQEGKTPIPQITAISIEPLKSAQQLLDEAKKKKQSELLKQVDTPFVPKDPPAEFEFTADPPSISAHDLDVVKLTAQFVARNGRQFLSSLMTREQRNYQFDFLRPQHSLFQYFTKLLEQYTKVLIPPKDIAKRLEKEDRKKILDDVKYRSNWIKHQEAQRRKEEEEAEKERMAYASIDWHDFVVVETVDYQPFEQGHFPPPTNPQEVGARVLLQDRLLQGQTTEKETAAEENFTAQDDTEVQDMEEDSSSEEEEEETQPPPPTGPSQPQYIEQPREEMIIKKGYDPKQANKFPTAETIFKAANPEDYTISPITGERIPVSKLQEHVRIGLLDPRWREQNQRQLMERANQESVYAPGSHIDESLKLLAERRSDIFGTGVEETPIGKKVGEEERIPGMPWNPMPRTDNEIVPAPPVTIEDKNDESKKDSIGPAIEQQIPPPRMPQPPPPTTQGILAPPLPQLPGIIRPHIPPIAPPGQQPLSNSLSNIPGPPGVPPGMMNAPRPLLGHMPHGQPPNFSHFNPAPPGTLSHRPPLLAPAPPPIPSMSNQPPPQIPQPPMHADDEPAAKKAKVDESLIPEEQFLATHKSPATFTIALPSLPEKPEMNLNGQLIAINMSLTEPISKLKAQITEAIGLAPGKQKLRLTEGRFFQDSFTLAYYNVGEGSNVHLSLKERGGRKK